MGKHRKVSAGPDGRDYPIGYMKPPAHSQFQKGKSGNPSGRPKKMKSEKEVLEAVMAQEYEAKTANGIEKQQGIELAVKRLFKAGVSGCDKHLKLLFQRIDATGAGREEPEDVDLTAADEAMLEEFLEHARRVAGKGSPDGD